MYEETEHIHTDRNVLDNRCDKLIHAIPVYNTNINKSVQRSPEDVSIDNMTYLILLDAESCYTYGKPIASLFSNHHLNLFLFSEKL